MMLLGVFWAECEVADLKQRQRTNSMEHRNKTQSLVLPTDDPGDAQAVLLNMAPVPVNIAACAIQHRPLKISGFP